MRHVFEFVIFNKKRDTYPFLKKITTTQDKTPQSAIGAMSASTSAIATPALPVDPAQAAREAAVAVYLDKGLRVTLSDGRLVTGRLNCFDAQRNLIVHDAIVTVPATATAPAITNSLYQVLVPGKHVIKIEVETEVRK